MRRRRRASGPVDARRRRPAPVPRRPNARGRAAAAPRARAEAALLASTTIDEVARRCGVRRSTAWQYVTTTCEASARAARHVLDGTALVCPELRATASGVDLTGSLTTVMERVAERLDGDVAWRCEKDNRYAQLQLLRVCLGRVADRDAEAKDDDGQRDVSPRVPGLVGPPSTPLDVPVSSSSRALQSLERATRERGYS